MQYLRILQAFSFSLQVEESEASPMSDDTGEAGAVFEQGLSKQSKLCCEVEGFNMVQQYFAPSLLPQFLSLKHNASEGLIGKWSQ